MLKEGELFFMKPNLSFQAFATTLAALGASTLIVACGGSPDAKAPVSGTEVSAPQSDTLVDSTLDQAAARVRSDGVRVEIHAVEAEPADALLKVAGDVAARMIVVGSRGMHGARRVLGSVPNTVSHQAACGGRAARCAYALRN